MFMAEKAILEIRNYSKTYGEGKKAADNVSLTVMSGDIYGFIGHNGAGKSTTIRAVVGVLDFTEGDIFIDGHSVKTESMDCKRITAYIPDNPDLYSFMTGIQYLNFVADIFGISAEDRDRKIHRYAELFEIEASLANLISSYSHGMKQKLAVIGALIHDPKLIIMDEPFVGLDPKAAYSLKQIMREHCDNGGSIFFSTHVLDVAEKLCDKVAIIRHGQLIKSGTMEDVRGDESLEEVFLELGDDENAESADKRWFLVTGLHCRSFSSQLKNSSNVS
jgi:ABC-2 type transport system ATP-binding protein